MAQDLLKELKFSQVIAIIIVVATNTMTVRHTNLYRTNISLLLLY